MNLIKCTTYSFLLYFNKISTWEYKPIDYSRSIWFISFMLLLFIFKPLSFLAIKLKAKNWWIFLLNKKWQKSCYLLNRKIESLFIIRCKGFELIFYKLLPLSHDLENFLVLVVFSYFFGCLLVGWLYLRIYKILNTRALYFRWTCRKQICCYCLLAAEVL